MTSNVGGTKQICSTQEVKKNLSELAKILYMGIPIFGLNLNFLYSIISKPQKYTLILRGRVVGFVIYTPLDAIMKPCKFNKV